MVVLDYANSSCPIHNILYTTKYKHGLSLYRSPHLLCVYHKTVWGPVAAQIEMNSAQGERGRRKRGVIRGNRVYTTECLIWVISCMKTNNNLNTSRVQGKCTLKLIKIYFVISMIPWLFSCLCTKRSAQTQ